MKDWAGEWQLHDLQRCWSDLIDAADRWPQRVVSPDGHGYVISADIYKRFFIGFTFEDEDDEPGEVRGKEGIGDNVVQPHEPVDERAR
ncbi:MAG TPA: hypothetical protein VGX50_11775 [Longimicrobium sp.]|jgi:hypothetical protein|nr:hypothetical protein [Longimicrobium sp.]